jgi:hypothetical protein
MTDQASSTPSVFTRAEIESRVAKVPRWWHSIDLGQGVVTPGHKTSSARG